MYNENVYTFIQIINYERQNIYHKKETPYFLKKKNPNHEYKCNLNSK